jgi:hypothetical protein
MNIKNQANVEATSYTGLTGISRGAREPQC